MDSEKQIGSIKKISRSIFDLLIIKTQAIVMF